MFELKSKFSPTGDQPQAIDKLVESLNDGNKNQVLLGVTGSGKTFTIANVINRVKRPALILAPNKTLAAQLYSEYKAFFPNNAVEYFVSYYDYYQPEAYIASTDTYIEKDSSTNEEIDKLRHAATAALVTRKDVIIVASVSAIYGLGSPNAYRDMALSIDVETGITRREVLHKLIDIRYERNDMALERGKFRVKGDVIDIIPQYMENGYRLEFFGDNLEILSEINVLTGQKVRPNIARVTILPATQYIAEEERMKKIMEEIRDELEKRVKYFEEKKMYLEAQRIRQRTEFDLEMIQELGYCKGIENYARYIANRKPGESPYTLMDYYSDDMIIFVDESHIALPQVRGMYNGDRARKDQLIKNGFRLPSAFDNRPLQFEEFLEKATQLVFISATPGDFEIENARGCIVEQLIRPTGIIEPEVFVRPIANQVDDLLEEIRIRSAKKERVLVTTLTKKMAEELTEYYQELGINVEYMHSDIDTLDRIRIIHELREGKFDVLIGINLLREGLDLPEVSLVAVLEADKEGFLRSTRSLIQTMGRAARNINGQVILYADKITGSMKEAMSETTRRREKQNKYNIDNNIDPKTIQKEISKDLVELDYATIMDNEVSYKIKKLFKTKKEIEQEIKRLEVEMKRLSKEFNFEEAINKRDEMLKLKEILLEF